MEAQRVIAVMEVNHVTSVKSQVVFDVSLSEVCVRQIRHIPIVY